MKTDDPSLDALITANVAWLDLAVEEAWRPAIRQSLAAFAGAIQAVEAFSLPDDAEPAPVFEA
jgi:Protein of unknown function (DUF4089)